jgi:hypothetical protein
MAYFIGLFGASRAVSQAPPTLMTRAPTTTAQTDFLFMLRNTA